MKKLILPIMLVITVAGLMIAAFHFSLFSSPGVLEINTTPAVTVMINNQNLGKTPFKMDFRPQRLEIKLLSSDTTGSEENILWQGKVTISSSTLSLINYTFENEEQKNYGEILTFSKIPDKKNGALLVSSYPDGAVVNLDGETKGYTPILLENISPGQHILETNLSGYNNNIVGINIAEGFQLNAEIKLSQSDKVEEEENSETANENGDQMVTILSTPTGWLRVRSGPGTGYEEIDKVTPGDKYPFLEKSDNWLKISLDDKTEGWISVTYGQIEKEEAEKTN